MLAFILITYGIFGKNNSVIKQQESAHVRGVITTLIRSNNQSIFLTINMLHSVLKFHSYNTNHSHSFIIFHDQNFTMSMREQILSCVLKTHKHAQISFALVDFQTLIQPSDKSRLDKTIGYRLMCRFWSYDVFYHPVILQNQYDYLMRMDDDSYFSDQINEDLFVYMYKQKLDYMYRATYQEKTPPMELIEKRYLTQGKIDQRCIYNNFFIIRLKWLYKSKKVQNFLHELIVDNLMLREYIGDGCVHATMLKIDDQVKSTRMTDIPYGHNYHVMPSTRFTWMFRATNSFYKEIQNSCDNLIVLRGAEGALTRINLLK
jgi:hypothetical protein